jgi:hypothetical protein
MYDTSVEVTYTTTEEYQECLLKVFGVADMDFLHTAISDVCNKVDLSEEIKKLHYDMPAEVLPMLLFSYDHFKGTHEAITTMLRTPRSCSPG